MTVLRHYWQKIDGTIAGVEKFLVAACLLILLSMSFAQVVMRNVFGTGWPDSELLARNFVIWTAMLGASLATRNFQHITIEVVVRFASQTSAAWLHRISDAVAAAVSFFLLLSVWRFLVMEHALAEYVIPGLPVWVAQSVLAWCFGMITLRFLMSAILGREAS